MSSLLDKMKEAKDASAYKKKSGPEKDAMVYEMDEEFIKAIEAAYAEDLEVKFKKKLGFSASDTIKCDRRWVYLFRGTDLDSTFSLQGLRIMANGHSVHERMYKDLKKAEILIEEEIWMEHDDPPIRAYIDCYLQWRGEKIIGEVKSINDLGFQWRKDKQAPKDDHIMQVHVYMYITGLRKAMIIYENKNSQEILPFIVEYDEELAEKIMKRWRKVWKMFQEGKLPKRPARTPESKICTYCDLKEKCWSDDEQSW